MKKMPFWLLSGAVIVSAALTACSAGTGSSTKDDASASGGEVSEGTQDFAGQKLTVWIMEGTNADSKEFFDEVSEKFSEQTGATLEVQMQPWSGAHDKFVTSIAGGTGPDVAEVGTTWVPEFADVGALLDLDDYIKEAGLEGKMVQGLVDAGTLDGKLYGMPWYAGVRAMVYNTELFDNAGITDVPANWDDIVATVEKLKEADSSTIPFPIAGDSRWSAMPFIWGDGGEMAVEKDGKWVSGLADPKSVAGLEFYTNLALEHNSSTAAAETWKETDLLSAFERGDVGMIVTGNWTTARIVDEAPDMEGKLGAFTIPGKDGGVAPSFLGGSLLSIFADSPNHELAWEFVKMMTTGELAKQWAEEAAYFPGEAAALDEYAASDDPLVAPFAKQMLEGGKSLPSTPAMGQTEGAKLVEKMLQNVLSGRMDAQAAAEDASAEMDSILEQAQQ